MRRLVFGGNGCGKSDYALNLLNALPAPRWMVVTGRAMDDDFGRRILAHRESRPPDIPVVETIVDIGADFRFAASRAASVLVEGLDFWMFSIVSAKNADEHENDFFAAIEEFESREMIFISAELSLGPIAADRATRAYLKRLGEFNRKLAGLCDEVVFMLAGLPVKIKGG